MRSRSICAATEFFKDGKYVYEGEGKTARRRDDMVDYLARLVDKYPIISIEDGMAEDDWDGWKMLTERARRQAASSSATISSSPTPSASQTGIDEGIANSILVKVNQIGTLTETLDAVELAHTRRLHGGHLAPLRRDRGRHHRRPRGGDQLRPDQDRLASRSDRIAKYNQLLRIEEELGTEAVYAGASGAEGGKHRMNTVAFIPLATFHVHGGATPHR